MEKLHVSGTHFFHWKMKSAILWPVRRIISCFESAPTLQMITYLIVFESHLVSVAGNYPLLKTIGKWNKGSLNDLPIGGRLHSCLKLRRKEGLKEEERLCTWWFNFQGDMVLTEAELCVKLYLQNRRTFFFFSFCLYMEIDRCSPFVSLRQEKESRASVSVAPQQPAGCCAESTVCPREFQWVFWPPNLRAEGGPYHQFRASGLKGQENWRGSVASGQPTFVEPTAKCKWGSLLQKALRISR